jgi:pyruvate dehydrogenase E1 component alpha subunit
LGAFFGRGAFVMDKVAAFEITYSRYVDPDGRAVQDLPGFAQDSEQLIAPYRAMVLTRAFDAKAAALQRTRRLGTFASSLGQEAVSVGRGAAMEPEDILVANGAEPISPSTIRRFSARFALI